MTRWAVKSVLIANALAGLLIAACVAQEPQPTSTSPPVASAATRDSTSAAIATLRKIHSATPNALLAQDDLNCVIREGGGGACATATGINVLQFMRLVAGAEPFSNLHQLAFRAFDDQPELLGGRVTNPQFVQLLSSFQKHLAGTKLTVEVESSPTYDAEKKKWAAGAGPSLQIAPRQIKVLSFTVTEADGKWVGRHFVVLSDKQDNEIVVFDAGKPLKELRYVLDYKRDATGDVRQVFLLQPAGAPARERIFELNTVFTAAIEGSGAGNLLIAPTAVGLERIKSKIDETAKELQAAGELISPRAWRKRSAAFGLPGLDLPVELGGSAWPAVQMLEAFRHAGRHNLNCRDVVGAAHARLLLNLNNDEGRAVLRKIAEGDAYVAITMTEPTAGSDYTAIKSTATKVDGGFRLTGEKRYVARLEQATHIVLFTRAASPDKRSLSAFVLPVDTPGLTFIKLKAHGLLGNSFGGLKFDNVFVKDSQLIGEDGKGGEIFVNHFRYWRLMQVAAALGTGERALDMLSDRLKTREAYGSPIGRFSHLQQPLGQYWTQLQMAHALAAKAAAMLDSGDDNLRKEADVLINGLKAEGVEIAIAAVDAAMRAHGAAGYSNEFDLGDRLNDLNGLRIADGTTDVMRMDVVRRRFGKELWNLAVRGIDNRDEEK